MARAPTTDLAEELRGVNLEGRCQPFECERGEVMLAALDRPHVGPVQTAAIGQGLLGPPTCLTQQADIPRDHMLESRAHELICAMRAVYLSTA